jgi:hypothetical protein
MPTSRSSTVRRTNQRAAGILIPAAVLLATIMGILAAAPAGLWLLLYVGTFSLIGWVAFEAAHLIVTALGRRGAR